MTKEEKYIEKVKDDRSLMERIAMLVPGFRGYKEKELRRDTDQLIRNKIYSTLRAGLRDLRWCYREVINSDLSDKAEQLNRVIMKTDRINEKIHHAKRGYSGIWQAVKVSEVELSELLRFDASLIDISEKLREDISMLKEKVTKKNFDETFRLISDFDMMIDEFDDKFSEREEVIIGLTKGGSKL